MIEITTISLPGKGEILVPVSPGQGLSFDFEPHEATFTKEGADLLLSFDNTGRIRLQSFFSVAADGDLPPLALGDGVEVGWDDFLSRMTGDASLMTAAGAASPFSGGMSGYEDNAGELLGGIERLNGLDALRQTSGSASALSLGTNEPPVSGWSGGLAAKGNSPASRQSENTEKTSNAPHDSPPIPVPDTGTDTAERNPEHPRDSIPGATTGETTGTGQNQNNGASGSNSSPGEASRSEEGNTGSLIPDGGGSVNPEESNNPGQGQTRDDPHVPEENELPAPDDGNGTEAGKDGEKDTEQDIDTSGSSPEASPDEDTVEYGENNNTGQGQTGEDLDVPEENELPPPDDGNGTEAGKDGEKDTEQGKDTSDPSSEANPDEDTVEYGENNNTEQGQPGDDFDVPEENELPPPDDGNGAEGGKDGEKDTEQDKDSSSPDEDKNNAENGENNTEQGEDNPDSGTGIGQAAKPDEDTVSQHEGAARSVLIRARETSNDKIIFQLLEKTTDADGNETWSPMAIAAGTDPASLVSLDEANGYLDCSSLELGDDGMLSVSVNQETVTAISNSQQPLETVLIITLAGYSYGMQVVIYGANDWHDYATGDFEAPEGGLIHGEWVTGLHGLGGSGSVTTGSGDDYVYLDRVNGNGGNEGGGDVRVDTGAGNDTIIARGNAISGSSRVSTGDGDDTFIIYDAEQSWSNIAIDMGSGDDTLTISGNVVSNSSISMGEGNDLFSLGGALSGSALMGNGDDTAIITGNANMGWSNLLHGGQGTDTLNLDGYGASFDLSALAPGSNAGIKGFEIIDLGLASATESGMTNILTITEDLRFLNIDAGLGKPLESTDSSLESLLADAAANVLRIHGEQTDSVVVGGNWKVCTNADGSRATVSYDGMEYTAFINQGNPWEEARKDFLLVESGLA